MAAAAILRDGLRDTKGRYTTGIYRGVRVADVSLGVNERSSDDAATLALDVPDDVFTEYERVDDHKSPARRDGMDPPPPSVSVVVATYCRPDVLKTCLEHLERQTAEPHEILVVDASPDRDSQAVVAGFSQVRYVRNDEGVGTLPRSRQIGVAETTGEVIAFLDDDAFADPAWLAELAAAYSPGVGGVGGQARNGQPGEEADGVDRIGRFCPDGTLTGFFAADPGKTIQVDHLIGCNMSFRRAALDGCGGIPVWPAGVAALREDLFLSLRVRDAGWKLLFNPRAGVRHIGAPQARGRRFDLRYDFTGVRNHLFVLVAHFGIHSPIVWRCVGSLLRDRMRTLAGATSRLSSLPVSVTIGIWRGIRYAAPAQGPDAQTSG